MKNKRSDYYQALLDIDVVDFYEKLREERLKERS